MMRPTVYLRLRKTPWGERIEQLWVNDSQTRWAWKRLPEAPLLTPMQGEGPPPIHGDHTKESYDPPRQ
jgi:hypothetical protein